jgi:hypothetical protein
MKRDVWERVRELVRNGRLQIRPMKQPLDAITLAATGTAGIADGSVQGLSVYDGDMRGLVLSTAGWCYVVPLGHTTADALHRAYRRASLGVGAWLCGKRL